MADELPTTPEERNLLADLDEKGTPSPWLYHGDSYSIGNTRYMLRAQKVGLSQEDALLLCVARNLVPRLLADIKRRDERIEELEAVLARIRDGGEGCLDCECEDHSDPDCCSNVPAYCCPMCLAGKVLEYARKL